MVEFDFSVLDVSILPLISLLIELSQNLLVILNSSSCHGLNYFVFEENKEVSNTSAKETLKSSKSAKGYRHFIRFIVIIITWKYLLMKVLIVICLIVDEKLVSKI